MNNRGRRPEVFIFESEAKAVLGAAESFARHGFRVVAGSSHRYCLGFYSRLVRERIIYPDEVARPQECVEFLLDLARKRRFDMILPLGDVVSQLVCSRRDEFMKYAKLVLVPYETFMIGRDKVQTMKAAEKCGVPIPRTYYPEEQSLDEIARQVEYPVLVKPAVSNGARGIRYAHNKAELLERYAEVAAEFGRTFVQEFVPHTGMQYKVELLTDRDGSVLASFAYAKIRFYPPTAGSSTLNLSLRHPEIVDYSVRMARSIGWYGMSDFDWIHDVRDGRPKLMEINPRVTDTIQIAQFCGLDFFRKLYQMASGEKVEPQTTYRTGLYMRFLPGDILWFLTTKGPRFGLKPSWFRFFGSDLRYLVTSWSDPGPTIGYILDALQAALDPQRRAFLFRMDRANRKPDRRQR